MINPPSTETGLWMAGTASAALALLGGGMTWVATYRYIRATPLGRKRIRHGYRIRMTWKRTAMNNGLARVDEVTKGKKDLTGQTVKPTVMVPKIKVIPEPWGLRIMVKTIAKVGVEEFEKAAGWLADAWGVERVEIVRNRPGLLEVRAVAGEPLDEHFPWDFGGDDLVLPLGRNSWGRLIGISLRELSGIKVAGMPGYGKTMLQLGWITQLATRPDVQFAVFDGKTSDPRFGDWAHLGQRAMFVIGDNPETANQRLTDLVRLIKDRPAGLVAERGTHKFWKQGPTPLNPLVLVVMDECHNYIDASGLKAADKALIEANQRLMRTIAKEGRGLGVIPVIATQKQTSDAIPTAVRDNLEVGVCFATFTLDAAVAALGDAIRDDEPNQPTRLKGKDRYVGVCTVTGVPGLAGSFDRCRVPDIDEDQAVAVIEATAHLRRDVIPAAAPVVRDAGVPAESPAAAVPLQKPTRSRRKAS